MEAGAECAHLETGVQLTGVTQSLGGKTSQGTFRETDGKGSHNHNLGIKGTIEERSGH